MLFGELIEALGERLGVPLQVDDDGMCVLLVDGMKVTLQDLPELDSVGLWGEIGEPPPQGLERLLSAMLEANHLFAGTNGATLSRDPATGSFFLCRLLDERCLDDEALATALERFITTLQSWCSLVKDYRESVPEAESPEETAALGLGGDGFLAV